MNRSISLHGALRDANPSGVITLDIPSECSVADLRDALLAHLREHAPQVSEGIVRRSAFATSETILHDHQPVPSDGELAVLPPVSGG
ncbi:MAG TPA: thiamine biosynthesis protein ThiS [Oleiagrimonas sp.]|nr:thiamine biosynthesis protein ThiS [Oleiagrimonas sp.]